MHAALDHENAEMVPTTGHVIRLHQGIADADLIIVQAAAAKFALGIFFLPWIPNLHLRHAAQIDAAIALGRDFPVHQQFKITILARRLQAAAAQRCLGLGRRALGSERGIEALVRTRCMAPGDKWKDTASNL